MDNELITLFGIKQSGKISKKIYQEFRLSTRLAFLLCSDKVVIPASNYFESPFAKKILDELQEFSEFGYLGLISSSMNVLEFVEKKKEQYSTDRNRYPIYFKSLESQSSLSISATWIPRNKSATEDITQNWITNIDNSSIWKKFFSKTSYSTVEKFEIELSKVPEKLEDSAFISDFVVPLLLWKDKESLWIKNNVNVLITKAYIESFLNEYNAICMSDFSFFDTSIILPNDRTHLSVSKIKRLLWERGLLESISHINGESLFKLKHSKEWSSFLSEKIHPLVFTQNSLHTSLEALDRDIQEKNNIPLSQPVEVIDQKNTDMRPIYNNIIQLNALAENYMSKNQGNDLRGAKFGGGYAEGNQYGGILNDYSSEQKQSLAEVAAEIEELLVQLQNQGVSPEVAQQQVAEDLATQAQKNPTVMGKLVKWSQSLSDTAAKTTVAEAAKEVFKLALRLSGIPIP
ncbi:hypothetical protein H6G35_00220 [Aulosira sp. FACHB-113]|uniref:hypothetical protein n=1 Tax=Tolypothrix tenuis TaxID=457083 RepID=UPI001685AF48|nr:hypothetical protein [Aulosira sp. FACHB-113]